MKVSKQLEEAMNLLRERADAEIKDEKLRDAVHWVIDANEEARAVVNILREKLSRVYNILERITKHPEFHKIMEEMKDDGEA